MLATDSPRAADRPCADTTQRPAFSSGGLDILAGAVIGLVVSLIAMG